MISRVIFAAAIAALIIVSAVPAGAQSEGALTGVVKDSNGGVLPGASVRIVNESSGANIEAVTDGGGTYTVAPLVTGTYLVEVALDGFQTSSRHVAVAGGQTRTDVTLSPSRLTESVVVTARRVEEVAQEVPIPVSVIRGDLVADAGAFNVNRMKEMLPSVQFYSTTSSGCR